MGRLGSRRGVAIVLAVAVGATACSGSSSKKGEPSTTSTLPTVLRLGAPPPLLATPTGTPAAQAVALALSTEPGTTHTIAGWLTAYDALGIPVVDSSGRTLGRTPSDPLAAPYWQVWYASGITKRANLRLTDFVRMLVLPSAVDADAAASALLADLRADATSSAADRQLFAHFVAEKAKQTVDAVDPLAPSVSASQVAIDPATAMLLGTEYARDALFTIVSHAVKRAFIRPGPGPRAVLTAVRLADVASGTDCSSIFGDSKELTTIVNALLQKFTQGASVPGTNIKIPGLIEQAQKAAGWSDDAVKGSQAAAKNISLMLSMLDLLIQVESLAIEGLMEPDPLVRTKHTSDGNDATITLQIRSEPDKALGDLGASFNSADWLACASQMMLSTMGVSLKLPESKEIAGAEVEITPKTGFGQWVLITDANALKSSTNGNGEIVIPVSGKAQKKEIPDSAKPFKREFSFEVSAQIKGPDLNSIISTFVDGFKFGTSASAGGGVKGLLDVLKTVHWDLGEQVFNETDWFPGWRVDGSFASYHFTGQVCDLDKPFSLQAESPDGIKGTFTITPTPGPTAKSGTYSFTGTGGLFPGSPGTAPITATGHIDLQKPVADDPAQTGQLRLDPGDWNVSFPIVGTRPLGPGGHHLGPTGDVLTLQPDPNVCQ